ncbi:MAG: ABC transporter substrate-binding protein [Alphaproteobacteria bacterium]|jgi:NitT/TauT family transport system substrate-binding protein
MKLKQGLTRRNFGKLSLGSAALAVSGVPSIVKAREAFTFAVPSPSALNRLPFWVATGEGYFEEEGLDPTLEAVDGSSQVLQAMAAGKAQIGMPGPGPTLGARSRGVDVKVFYNFFPKSVFGIFVKEESDYNHPSDLKGTILGVGTADGAEVSFAGAIMADLGMKAGDDFEYLPVGDGGTAAVAFMRDEVNSYVGSIADAAILAARGMKLREITPDEYLSFFGNGMAMLESQMNSMPELAPKFGRAIVRAMRFASMPENKEKCLAHCAVGNPQEAEESYAPSLFDLALGRMTPTSAYKDRGFGYMPPEHWQLIHDSSVASGAIPAPLPDLHAVYTNHFVNLMNA